MAPPFIHPNQLHTLFPSSSATTVSTSSFQRHRRSKAQTCFFKILHIISVFSAGDVSGEQCLRTDNGNCVSRGLDVDLNVGLREIEPFEPPESADNERSEKLIRDSEISHVVDRSSGIDYVSEKRRDEGYLGLLIEAAQLILAGENESKPTELSPATEINRETKRKESWTEERWPEFEGALPVLKTKRGRNLVLPEKYRDSFVEPVIRWTPAAKRSKWPVETVASKPRSKSYIAKEFQGQ